MFQTGSNLSVPDNKSEVLPVDQGRRGFPQIGKKPSSRGQMSSKKDLLKKKKLNLPSVAISKGLQQNIPKTDRYYKRQSKKNIQNLFEQDPDEKLKMLLPTDNNGDTAQQGESLDSQDFDFELKVKKNKQIIQHHKQRNNSPNKAKLDKKKSPTVMKERTEKIVISEPISKNKILSKRKSTQNSKEKDAIRGSIQSMKPKMEHRSPKKYELPPKVPKKPPIQKQENKIKYVSPKKENVFDSIQNFLQNPQESKKKEDKVLIGLSLLKAKRDLEDKLKLVNEKIQQKCEKKHLEEITKVTKFDEQRSDNDWKRLKNFHKSQFHFDNGIDKIASLQQKTEKTLTDYLEYQQLMMEVAYQKKFNKK